MAVDAAGTVLSLSSTTGSNDPADVARGIEWAAVAHIDRTAQHRWVADRFDAPIIAQRYLNLING